MLRKPFSIGPVLILTLSIFLLAPSLVSSSHLGIGGEQTNSNDGSTINDVAKEGCLCHNGAANNAIQIILVDVPYSWIAGEAYEMTLQIIGGPQAASPYTAGFSMRVSAGELSGENVQNWEDELTTLTHTGDSAGVSDRAWTLTWVAPATGNGAVNFWITGNSVNGDQGPGDDDKWNQLLFSMQEGNDATTALGKRTLFAGDGNVSPPVPEEGGVDLEHMGAEFRAHILGLLGFGAVLAVVLFSGLMLRYSFSTSYRGRSNLLRLRYKIRRRGDQ
ncbi:MAG: hypothetical protein QF479_02275 [Candidatus Poseidoniaceae archaeon]|nr:hypothetical protein [Candidatus Poseidoniaceae archaeon]